MKGTENEEKNENKAKDSMLDNGLTPEQQRAIINRMSKMIGHIKRVRTMVEEGRDCSEVLIQLSAVKSAVNGTGKEVLKLHLNDILDEVAQTKDLKKLDELNRLLETFMK